MILEDRLITALDVPTLDKASKLVLSLGETVTFYKVGMELYYGAGPSILDYLKKHGKKIFLDLKLHDIPNTVNNSVAVLTGLGIDMMTIHAGGGREMMAKAAQSAKESAEKLGKKTPLVVGVTVLTSLNEEQFKELNYKVTIKQQALELAKLAQEAGLSGVVASPEEAADIRNACGKDFLIVTPGIRLADGSKDDQSRIATPASALEAGASHIVVGRPISKATDAKEAAKAIINSMREARI